MTARTPVQKGTAGYCQPGWMFQNNFAATPNTLTNGRLIRASAVRHQVTYFSAIAFNNVWAACPSGTVACAFQQHEQDATPGADTMNANHQPAFPINATISGWLHTWERGVKFSASGGTVTPGVKGTTLWLDPFRAIRAMNKGGGTLNDSEVTGAVVGSGPTVLGTTGGRTIGKHRLRHQVFHFNNIENADTCTTFLKTFMVACAWQSNTVTDGCQTLFNTDGLQFFTAASPAVGWLHVWFA